MPPPAGDPDAPARALIFDSEFDQYRGVIAYIRVVDGTFRKGEAIRAMAAGTEADIDDIGFFTPAKTPVAAARPGRGRLPHHRHQGRHEAARRRHAHDEARRRDRGAARLPRGQADGLLRPVPDRLRRLPGPARRAREAHAQRRGAAVGARDLRRARLRLPLRLPRPAAHGHRARAPRARVRPRADGDDAVRRLRAHAHRRRGPRGPQPVRHARPGARSTRSASRTSAPRSCRRRSTSARSWSSARSAAASTQGMHYLSAPSASRSTTTCRSPRSCSTSSTS